MLYYEAWISVAVIDPIKRGLKDGGGRRFCLAFRVAVIDPIKRGLKVNERRGYLLTIDVAVIDPIKRGLKGDPLDHAGSLVHRCSH